MCAATTPEHFRLENGAWRARSIATTRPHVTTPRSPNVPTEHTIPPGAKSHFLGRVPFRVRRRIRATSSESEVDLGSDTRRHRAPGGMTGCRPRVVEYGRHAVGVQRFVDDDDGYLRWLAAHGDGFVLNTERPPKPSYLVLHRASCPKITRLQRGASRWTRDYIKFCGHRAELEAFARHEIGGEPRCCGICATSRSAA
jgi:hypothetical protein